MAGGTEQVATLRRREPLTELAEECAEQRGVRVREQLRDVGRERVDDCRLPRSAAASALLSHDPVALQRGEMRADRVVGETERPRELIDRERVAAEKLH